MTLDILRNQVTDRFGLSHRPEWKGCGEKAIVEMTKRRRCEPSDLLRLAETDKKTLMEFASYLTVSETYFLRHSNHYDHLVKYVDNLWLEKRPEKIVVWSAGCSTGEEPYSAAIVLRESSKTMVEQHVEIWATDINHRAIAKALKGEFAAWSFRDVPSWFKARYFHLDKEVYHLSESIRNLVSFKCIDLQDFLSLTPPDSVDVALFRNVAIYLEKQALDEIYRGFATVLREGGCLMVSPADPRPPAGLFAPCDLPGSSVYRMRSRTCRTTAPVPRHPLLDRRRGRTAKRGSTARSRRRMPRLSNKTADLQTVRQYADQGEADKALEMINQIIAAHPAAKEGYLLRGQIHLANRRTENAVEDLRRTIYIDSEHKIARFWFAYALQKNGLESRAGKHLDILSEQLGLISVDTVLEDGDTSAGELLQTVMQMKASLK